MSLSQALNQFAQNLGRYLHHATANTIDDPLSKERESHISEYSTETSGSSRTATDNGPSSGAYKTHGGAQVTEICNDSRPIKPIT